MENGLLIVITGKTASGKDTIQTQLLSRYPDLKRIITTTSRTPRPGEQEGIDYYFISKEEFESKIRDKEFAEYVNYGGNLYGTYKKELAAILNGHTTMWRIDPSRAGEGQQFVKNIYPQAQVVVIYITTSDEVVLQRLKDRDLSEEEIEKRMRDDQKIWQKFKNNYDFVIENVPGKLDQTIDKIYSIINNYKEA